MSAAKVAAAIDATTAAERLLAVAAATEGAPCVLLMFGELTLKRRKRPVFVAALERNLRVAAAEVGSVDVRKRGSSFLVFADPEKLATLIRAALDVPGVSVVQPALRLEPTVAAAARAAVELLRPLPPGSFAVRARRREKAFPVHSDEIARVVGAEVQQ